MLSESVSECEHARRLDPGVKLNSSTPNGYLYFGQYDRFLDSLPKTDDVALIVFYRGFGEYYKKNSEQAETNFDHAFELDPSLLQAEIGRAFSLGIRHQGVRAAAILRTLEAKINERGVVDPEAIYKIAQAYATIGDNVSSLRVLRHSIENGFFPYPYFAVDPLLDTLRGEEQSGNNKGLSPLFSVHWRASFLVTGGHDLVYDPPVGPDVLGKGLSIGLHRDPDCGRGTLQARIEAAMPPESCLFRTVPPAGHPLQNRYRFRINLADLAELRSSLLQVYP